MSIIHRQIHPVEFKKRNEQQVGSSQPPASTQQLVAGYMAYEFLTRGTLLGQELNPGQPESVTARRSKSEELETMPMRADKDQRLKKKRKSYAEVASLLKTDGAHLPWIVNPTQLANWVQM